jgi:hypothetical protein
MGQDRVTLGDLVDLPRPGHDGALTLEQFLADPRVAALDWPVSVVEQFLYDHGGDEAFLADYGSVDLRSVTWSLESLLAYNLRWCRTGASDQGRIEQASTNHGELLASYPQAVQDGWEQTGTWLVPPVLLDRSAFTPPGEGLQVVEGRARMGVLRGRIKDRLMMTRRLDVWVGRPRSTD